MSAPLLRRLQQPRELHSEPLGGRRWCSTATDARDIASTGPHLIGLPERVLWSSGRRAADGLLVAERLDDGLLVAETADLPGEPIVWLGDLAVTLGEDPEVGDPEPSALASAPVGLGAPRIRLGTLTPRVEAVWSVNESLARVECTLPCRPVGQRTHQNDALDPRVQLEATESGAVARVRPYPGMPAIILRFNGDVTLVGAALWHSDVAVLDRTGPIGVEDRFSPGVFLVRLPETATSLRVTVEVEADLVRAGDRRAGVDAEPAAEPAAEPDAEPDAEPEAGPGVGPLSAAVTARGRLMDILSAPGLALEAGWSPDQISSWIKHHVAAAVTAIGGPGEVAGDDSALWLGRTCQLLLRNLRSAWGPLTYRGLVEDCFAPAVASMVDAILAEAPGAASASELSDGAVGESPPTDGVAGFAGAGPGEETSPGAARFRGTRRWYEVLASTPSVPRGAVCVEAGALLHQLFIFDEQLCRMTSNGPRREQAARRALDARRWFQRAFWLSTPRRLADLEVSGSDPVGGTALSMRAGMLVAAALEGAPLDQMQRRAVVNAADERLLTPLGVRSIDRADLGFHQDSPVDGAVWPWLLGMHVEAAIRAFGRDFVRLDFEESLLAAIDGAPEAWAERSEGGVSPIGDLTFPPASGESIRAFRLLTEVLGGTPE